MFSQCLELDCIMHWHWSILEQQQASQTCWHSSNVWKITNLHTEPVQTSCAIRLTMLCEFNWRLYPLWKTNTFENYLSYMAGEVLIRHNSCTARIALLFSLRNPPLPLLNSNTYIVLSSTIIKLIWRANTWAAWRRSWFPELHTAVKGNHRVYGETSSHFW